MANIQLESFGELFGSENSIQRFRSRNYNCPFDQRIANCDKPNRGNLKYGSCSAKVSDQKRIICPRRFYENNYQILKDIKEFIWHQETTIDCYSELQIQVRTADNDRFHYGNLDWVLVNQESPRDFCGVEIQTDATTGTGAFRRAIEDLLNDDLNESYGFGLNTLASFKGFLPQFIFKGQLFDDWKKPYVAVIQDELWEKFKSKFRIRYKHITEYTSETFMFFVYSLVFDDPSQIYKISNLQVYSSRWIDLLFSFSVESDLLIDLNSIVEKIENKIDSNIPVITFTAP